MLHFQRLVGKDALRRGPPVPYRSVETRTRWRNGHQPFEAIVGTVLTYCLDYTDRRYERQHAVSLTQMSAIFVDSLYSNTITTVLLQGIAIV